MSRSFGTASFRTAPGPTLVISGARLESVVRTLRDEAIRFAVEMGLRHAGDAVGLIVSELVTNAVRYGVEETFDLRIIRLGRSLRIEVDDRTPGSFAMLRSPAEDFECGRGLLIVDALAEAWGTSADGRVTWALVSGESGAGG